MMTKLTYKITFILVIGLGISLHATEPSFKKEFTREIHKTFDVSPDAKLGIQNRHGDISIDTWDQNKIQVDVLIKVKTNNSEKGQKFLDGIEIAFSTSSSKVMAKTVLPDHENNSWWSGWFSNNKNLDYEVHYTIQAPKEISSTLINKYGNINQASISGDCDVTNKYGDITLENVSGNLDLNLGYGKAVIGETGNSKMQVKYSSIKLLSAQDLDITTKYSNVKIQECGTMISHTKYDDYTIESLGNFRNSGKYDDFTIASVDAFIIDTKYTDVKINSLNQKASFETKYGSVDVKSTNNNLEKVNIQSKYTGIKLAISGDFHLNFDGSHTGLYIEQPYEKYSSDKDGSDLKVKAYRGSKNSGAMINATMGYGKLKIH